MTTAVAPSSSRLARRMPAEPVAGPIRAVLFVMYGLPLAWIVVTSLKEQGAVLGGAVLWFTPSLEAYREALANPQLPIALLQSAQIATGTALLVLVLGAPLAYALAQHRGWWPTIALGTLVFLQMVPQTANIIPLFALFYRAGLLDSTTSLILANTALLLPWATLLLRPFFLAVSEAIEEAAAIDGAGRVTTFIRVVVPLARNGIATVGALIFLVAWGEFLYAINLMISPINYPMSALIAQQTSGYGVNWPGLMALATLSAVPVLIVYVFSFRLLRDGLALGATK